MYKSTWNRTVILCGPTFSFMYIAIYVENKRIQKPSGEKKKKKMKKNVHFERYAPDIFSNSSSYAENK